MPGLPTGPLKPRYGWHWRLLSAAPFLRSGSLEAPEMGNMAAASL